MTAVVLSILALILSLASLSWQAWSWSRSGPVMHVEVTNILTDAGSLTYGNSRPEWYVEVRAVNKGRAPATVQSWGIQCPGDRNMVVMNPEPFSDRLPARIEPHASASFHIEADAVRAHAADQCLPFTKMRPWIRLQTGKQVFAKKTVPLA